MKKKGFTRTYLQIILLVGLISLFAFSLDKVLNYMNDYMSGFTLSFGVTVMAFSLIMLNSKKFLSEAKIKEQDERHIMIKHKQLGLTYYFHMFFSVVAIIVSGSIEALQVVSLFIAGMILLETIFLAVVGVILNRKY